MTARQRTIAKSCRMLTTCSLSGRYAPAKRLELSLGMHCTLARKHTSTGTFRKCLDNWLQSFIQYWNTMLLNGYVQLCTWLHVHFTHRQCQLSKAKALRHKVTSSYGEKAQHTTDSGLSVLKSLPWGFHSASDCERIPFRVHHPSYSVNFLALRSCQGMSMGVPDPEDIGPGSTPSCS